MGVPTSEVGYTPAMPRSVDHEVHKDMWWHWTKKNHNIQMAGEVCHPLCVCENWKGYVVKHNYVN